MKRGFFIALLLGVIMYSSAQICADCSIGLPTLTNEQTVGEPTILEYSNTGLTGNCLNIATNPNWSVAGEASIISGENSDRVTISATGNYELTLNYESDGEAQSCALETAANVFQNPSFTSNCGLNIIMVLDESNSISAVEEEGVRDAVRSLITALQGSGSNLAIVEFGTYAEAESFDECGLSSEGSPNYSPLTQANIQGCFENYLVSDYGFTSSGGTNWDDGFRKVSDVISGNALQPDVVLFFTDGNPTFYIDEQHFNILAGSGSTTFTSTINHAIVQANLVKMATHLFVIGVGDAINEENIQLISGPQHSIDEMINADYVIAPDFEALANDFLDIGLSLCGTDVSLTYDGPSV